MRRWIAAGLAVGAGSIFAIGLAVPAGAVVSTLYVGGANCSDGGAGTATQPYCTIVKAGTVATAGQTVLVASGSYSGTVVVAKSGTAAAPITFQPAPGASPAISAGPYGFSVSGKAYVVISGFSISGTTHNGIAISNSDHITITGNTVTLSGQPVSGQIAAGIVLSGTTNSTVTGNRADNNSDTGIYLKSGTTGTTVGYNEASGNANGYQRNANGINVISPGNTIIGNVLHDNEDSGLQFYTGGNDNLATLNVSYNNGDHGIDDLNVTGGRLIGNTIYHNCTSGINVEGTSGNYLVENNIAVDNAVYPAYHGISCSRRAGNIGIWDSAPASTTVDSNLVYLSKAGTMYVFGTAYASLAAMRSATGQEQYGLQADPQFVAPASGNLQLAGTSPAIDSADSGASGEQLTDALGNPRVDVAGVPNTGRGPRDYDDRGAYEYGGGGQPPPNQPPVARLAVNPATGTEPVTVIADASASTDPEGQPLTYRFDFGDGTVVGPQPGATAGHSYSQVGSYQVTLTVTDPGGLSATATGTVAVSAPTPPSSAKYVGQIATNYSTSRHTSGSITVWRAGGVTAGHLMVVTVNLTGTTAGAVTGTDSAGDRLTVASDVLDAAGHRLLVLAGVSGGLAPNQTITVSFPSAATYRITGDDVSGVTAVDAHAESSGTGSAFAAGPVSAAATGEFVFSTVGAYAASAPGWAAGWTALTGYAVGTDYLGRAYQLSKAAGTFTGAGSVNATSWLAAAVSFH
ncbi:MAG TPA: PKD domain-containing protein [Jatrophihabitans sp.]|nr:PKD domain-containing protein [Jatrophihabitans sp.]